MKKLLLLLFSAVFLFGCAPTEEDCFRGDDLSDVTLKKGKKHTVPFKSNFQLLMDEQVVDFPMITQTVLGTGNATHLGKTNIVVEETITMTPPPWTENNPWIASVNVTFTASNGDELYVKYESEINAEFAPNLLIIEGEGKIIGGSGRFTGAGGDLVYTATFNPSDNTGEATFTGDIIY